MRKLVLILGSAALAVLVAAPVAQAAPKFDLAAGSGTWSGNPAFGVPTLHVYASDQPGVGGANDQFTINYGEDYLVQGPITAFSVTGNSNKGDAQACLVGRVDKEQGQDPASGDNSRFDVGEYVPMTIAKVGADWKFNFGPSSDDSSLRCINPELFFDPGASFTIFDAP
jgi:hypothetical protein